MTFANQCLIAFCFQSLDGHHGAITCVKFDEYHIITGSLDCYAMAWSSIGKHKKCLQAFRHPKYVNSYCVVVCFILFFVRGTCQRETLEGDLLALDTDLA